MLMLDKRYIEAHLPSVQNYESFGRNVCEAILRECMELVAESPKEEVEIPITVKVRPEQNPTGLMCIYTLMVIGRPPRVVYVHIFTGMQ